MRLEPLTLLMADAHLWAMDNTEADKLFATIAEKNLKQVKEVTTPGVFRGEQRKDHERRASRLL
jgi:hypothetical protein